jgi:hypothetical protein
MTGKNRVAAIVSDDAKANLVEYQNKNGIKTRDDAVEAILLNLPKWIRQSKALAPIKASSEEE